LILQNLNDFNIDYLQALFHDDRASINFHEEAAAEAGYGPLAPCKFVGVPREQKEFCRELFTRIIVK